MTIQTIDCFILHSSLEQLQETVNNLRSSSAIANIFVVTSKSDLPIPTGCKRLQTGHFGATKTFKEIAKVATAPYTLLYTSASTLQMGLFAIERMMQISSDSGAGMVYADSYKIVNGQRMIAPVIEYQRGSLRDDFCFGSVLLYDTNAFCQATDKMRIEYSSAALYDHRLKLSQEYSLVHINEYLYSVNETIKHKSGERMFDYVDPKNRAVQLEMESACTEHLKEVGAYLAPNFSPISFDETNFEVEASVIIPVRNRIKTVNDAIRSVLSQQTTFKFNLIIIDNHSTDGTTEAIQSFTEDKRLIHIIPEREDLGIGGCWNIGVHSDKCGKFAVQLDSDDIYKDNSTLQTMVDAFYQQNCAMVVGTYQMTDFNLNEIPPGIIDHKEWTPDNGRNNALRINGLGAPRAFYTPVLRNTKLPNTSYGEDYALGLNISRNYQIGRIYDIVYLCRRWDDNSDASIDIVKQNAHNTYKDRIRTWELNARISLNKK